MSGSTFIPHLCCRNAAEAADFYERAFGAQRLCLFKDPSGRVMHGEMIVNGATFYLVDEMPQYGVNSPLSLGGAPVSLYLRVPDCEGLFARAVDAGCNVQTPLQDMFWGDRYGMVIDPYGHRWEIATTVRQVSHEEMLQVLQAMGAAQCPQPEEVAG